MYRVKEIIIRNKENIWIILLFVYVTILVLATISEIFDLGWFR